MTLLIYWKLPEQSTLFCVIKTKSAEEPLDSAINSKNPKNCVMEDIGQRSPKKGGEGVIPAPRIWRTRRRTPLQKSSNRHIQFCIPISFWSFQHVAEIYMLNVIYCAQFPGFFSKLVKCGHYCISVIFALPLFRFYSVSPLSPVHHFALPSGHCFPSSIDCMSSSISAVALASAWSETKLKALAALANVFAIAFSFWVVS